MAGRKGDAGPVTTHQPPPTTLPFIRKNMDFPLKKLQHLLLRLESRICPITGGAEERERVAVDNKEAYKLDKEQGSKVGVKRLLKAS